MPLDTVRQQLQWHLQREIPTLAANDVHVWLLRLTGEYEETAAACLSPQELDRADRFRFDRHRREYVHCRTTLRRLLAGYLQTSPAEIEIVTTRSGKPYISSAGLHFNVSHSGEYALIAFSHNEIGVDIEQRDPKFIDQGTLDICLSPRERTTFDNANANDRLKMFFDIWTAKESYLKLAGDGLAVEPNSIDLNFHRTGQPVIGGNTVFFSRCPPIRNYSAAIALRVQASAIGFYTLD